MGVSLEINNITKSPIAEGFFETVAEKTFAQLGYDFLDSKNVSISVALVSPEEIRKLNKEYRKYDSVTDILSFPEYENLAEIGKAVLEKREEGLFLGELILCYNDIKEYADENGIDLKKELANVTAHGVLHLLGFQHGEEMFAVQKTVTDK